MYLLYFFINLTMECSYVRHVIGALQMFYDDDDDEYVFV